MPARWIDVTAPLRDGMVHWPDNPPVRIVRTLDVERGDPCNVSAISMGAHTGTHVDAPVHFLGAGAGIDSMPFSATIGLARVIRIRDTRSIKPAELAGLRIRRGERILFKTRNSARRWPSAAFFEDYVFVSPEAALFLVQRGVRTVGVDYLSVGGAAREGEQTHRLLLGAGIWIVEGLDLRRAPAGKCELICLPLRVARGDGAPARAFLRPIGAGPRRGAKS
jgi:arylformamidase